MSESEKDIGKAVDLSNIDLDKMREKTAELPGLLPYAHTVGGVVIQPEDRGKIRGKAMAAMYQQTDRQMLQLYEQMQTLLDQAHALKNRVNVSERIYEAAMGFEPVINQVYYLYQKKDGSDVLSMVGPDEWGRSFRYEACLAKVILLADHTWEVMEYAHGADTVD
jgi:hypothetical protein